MTVTNTSGFADASVHELRQYRMRPGGRDQLYELFVSDLIRKQEECGIRVGGVLADMDRPDRFVWFRGFPDHASRREALRSFYFGPAWAEHREQANETMLDSDDVLLLRPVFTEGLIASSIAGDAVPEHVGVAVLAGAEGAASDRTVDVALAARERYGATVVAWVRDPTPNDFPALPVRTDDVAVVAVRHPDAVARDTAHHSWAELAEAADLTVVQTARLTPMTLT